MIVGNYQATTFASRPNSRHQEYLNCRWVFTCQHKKASSIALQLTCMQESFRHGTWKGSVRNSLFSSSIPDVFSWRCNLCTCIMDSRSDIYAAITVRLDSTYVREDIPQHHRCHYYTARNGTVNATKNSNNNNDDTDKFAFSSGRNGRSKRRKSFAICII